MYTIYNRLKKHIVHKKETLKHRKLKRVESEALEKDSYAEKLEH